MTWPSNQPDAEIGEAELIRRLNQKFADSDAAAGIVTTPRLKRFSQKNDMFTRAFWDETIRSADSDGFFNSYRMEAAPRRGEGFNQRDFALRNASWAISDLISESLGSEGIRQGFQATIQNHTPVAPQKVACDDPTESSDEIRRIAKLFGADLVGITEIDERWHYTNRIDTRDFSEVENTLPTGLTHVIILGHAMDHDLVATYPSALAGASTGREYSHEAAIVIQLATYIRNLGYEAIASMNDTALVIPYAIKAGLGEYGRNQMVITPQFGPRVRFSKIFTSLPLKIDQPIKMGIKEYCDICTKCADACPPKALPFGPPQEGPPQETTNAETPEGSPSTLRGVVKWSANCEKCFGYWAKLKSDCAICMRVCPFNRPSKTLWQQIKNRIFLKLATGRGRRLALWWETKRGMPQRLKPRDWWASGNGHQ